jgi:hypothetical protein
VRWRRRDGPFHQPDCALDAVPSTSSAPSRTPAGFNGRSCYSFVGTASGNETGSPFACNVAFGGPEVVEPVRAAARSTTAAAAARSPRLLEDARPGDCHNGNNQNVWCDTNGGAAGIMTLGTVTYTDTQICSILNASAKGNGLIILAHQLIAAKFNACNGGATCDGADIAAADAFIGTKSFRRWARHP